MRDVCTITADWPRGPSTWLDGRTLCVSIPFTWNLPEVRHDIEQGGLLWDNVMVGGPATIHAAAPHNASLSVHSMIAS